jgi:hypothetical protein
MICLDLPPIDTPRAGFPQRLVRRIPEDAGTIAQHALQLIQEKLKIGGDRYRLRTTTELHGKLLRSAGRKEFPPNASYRMDANTAITVFTDRSFLIGVTSDDQIEIVPDVFHLTSNELCGASQGGIWFSIRETRPGSAIRLGFTSDRLNFPDWISLEKADGPILGSPVGITDARVIIGSLKAEVLAIAKAIHLYPDLSDDINHPDCLASYWQAESAFDTKGIFALLQTVALAYLAAHPNCTLNGRLLISVFGRQVDRFGNAANLTTPELHSASPGTVETDALLDWIKTALNSSNCPVPRNRQVSTAWRRWDHSSSYVGAKIGPRVEYVSVDFDRANISSHQLLSATAKWDALVRP